MSLMSAFSNARASLSSTSAQSAIVSRNIANVNDPSATRKYTNAITTQLGGVQVLATDQAADIALFGSVLSTTATLGSSQALKDGLDQLQNYFGDVDSPFSPPARLTALGSALSQFAISPENQQFAITAVDAARDMATSLNRASDGVLAVRQQADDDLKDSASKMTALLQKFENLNKQVVAGTAKGADVSDAVDSRNALVTELSGYVGLNIAIRANKDMVLSTDSGVVLFDKSARSIEYVEDNGHFGGQIKIDGIDVTGPTSPMPVKTGSLYGLVTLRDKTATTLSAQLDEMAVGLVAAFSETADSGADQKAYAGLFTDSAASGVAVENINKAGLAGRLRIAANVDQTQGGNPQSLRDGAISHPVTDPDHDLYVDNTTGGVGFADRLNELSARLGANRSFDGALGAGDKGSLSTYASAVGGWLAGQRSTATTDTDYGTTLLARTTESLSNKTGINIDDEMTRLLDLERSYQASSKLISTIGSMLDSLIAVV